jgi:hypothetical protein
MHDPGFAKVALADGGEYIDIGTTLNVQGGR